MGAIRELDSPFILSNVFILGPDGSCIFRSKEGFNFLLANPPLDFLISASRSVPTTASGMRGSKRTVDVAKVDKSFFRAKYTSGALLDPNPNGPFKKRYPVSFFSRHWTVLGPCLTTKYPTRVAINKCSNKVVGDVKLLTYSRADRKFFLIKKYIYIFDQNVS